MSSTSQLSLAMKVGDTNRSSMEGEVFVVAYWGHSLLGFYSLWPSDPFLAKVIYRTCYLC